MTSSLDGYVALVTGSASGIGEATARLLAQRGAAVVVADINEMGANRVAEEIERSGGRACAVMADVAEEDDCRRMVAQAIERFGRLDILHNNAAALGADVLGRDTDVINVPLETWDRTMAISLRGPMLGCRFALPHMLDQGRGSIINTASTAGQAGDLSRVAYGSAKAGVITLTKYVATMYGKRGVRCNAIAPGLILSPPAQRNMSPENLTISQKHQLISHTGVPEDIAPLVAFLASDDARFITGQTINADGGVHAHTPSYGDYCERFAETGRGWP
jgi:NAD(P)-dependent dehydrogenase (short-subunit alcohol dehydrogenase family)